MLPLQRTEKIYGGINMTTLELNAELFRQMSIIAEDEHYMRRALEYIKKLAGMKQMETLASPTKENSTQQPAQVSKIEFFPISDEIKSLAERIKNNDSPIDWNKQKEEYFKDKYGL